MLGVSSPANAYFLNAIDCLEGHAVYPLDYTVTLPIDGGATIRFLQSDPNCSMVKNCDAESVEGSSGAGVCNPVVVPDLTGLARPFDGQFIVLDVVSATR
jgi:hypothetical protein